MRIANRCHIAGWVVSAGSLALLAGCSWPFPSPFATRATVEDYVPQQTIHVPCPAMSIPEALDLAHRQCGLEWSAVAGAIDPADPAPVGPFQMDSDVPLSVLLDRVARAAGSG